MINSVVLMGRLTADPELRTTTTGRSVCSFTLAVDSGFQRAGEDRSADFINCVAWEQTANFISRYFRKGSMLAVTGRIQTRRYEDKTGAKRTAFEVVIREASFCGSKAETGTTGAQPQPQAQQQPPVYQSASSADFEEITDDEDLPF